MLIVLIVWFCVLFVICCFVVVLFVFVPSWMARCKTFVSSWMARCKTVARCKMLAHYEDLNEFIQVSVATFMFGQGPSLAELKTLLMPSWISLPTMSVT